jgi:endonuclease I
MIEIRNILTTFVALYLKQNDMRKFTTLQFLFIFSISILAQIPSGYYNTAVGKADAALKTALFTQIGAHTERSYNQLWTDFQTTDKRADGKVWDMYSTCTFTFGIDQDKGSHTPECTAYNREHSFPKSWFGGEVPPMYTDLFHMYPTDGLVNERRGNLPFGEVGTASYNSNNNFSKSGNSSFSGYSGEVFEPANEYKGDFARTYFYMVTAYENKVANWTSEHLASNSYPAFNNWSIALLLKWTRQDPVSTKEINRNNAVYGIQGNRNPFIDYPALAEHIWGTKKGIQWSTPSGIDDLRIEFSVSPNPASKFLNVKTDEQNTTYRIISLNGMLVESKKLNTSGTISIEQLNDGMYFIELQMGNRKAIQKFVVNN